MTYNVFSGTLNPTQSINLPWWLYCKFTAKSKSEKKRWKSVDIWQRYRQQYTGPLHD